MGYLPSALLYRVDFTQKSFHSTFFPQSPSSLSTSLLYICRMDGWLAAQKFFFKKKWSMRWAECRCCSVYVHVLFPLPLTQWLGSDLLELSEQHCECCSISWYSGKRCGKVSRKSKAAAGGIVGWAMEGDKGRNHGREENKNFEQELWFVIRQFVQLHWAISDWHCSAPTLWQDDSLLIIGWQATGSWQPHRYSETRRISLCTI